MSLKIIAVSAAAIVSLSACVGVSGEENRRTKAYNACYTKEESQKAACIRTQLALLEAEDRKWAEAQQSDQDAAERREAELEAYGVSEKDRRQTVDGPIKLPN